MAGARFPLCVRRVPRPGQGVLCEICVRHFSEGAGFAESRARLPSRLSEISISLLPDWAQPGKLLRFRFFRSLRENKAHFVPVLGAQRHLQRAIIRGFIRPQSVLLSLRQGIELAIRKRSWCRRPLKFLLQARRSFPQGFDSIHVVPVIEDSS